MLNTGPKLSPVQRGRARGDNLRPVGIPFLLLHPKHSTRAAELWPFGTKSWVFNGLNAWLCAASTAHDGHKS